MKWYAIIMVAVLLCACNRNQSGGAVGGDIDPSLLNERLAFAEVERLLEIQNRDSGTGAEKAARHILNRLQELGVSAEIDTFKDATPKGEMEFHNVVARISGKGEGIIILGSHFDTKSGIEGGFQGANDSGSSTGLLIELARVLNKSAELRSEVRIVFFDGEECMDNYGPHDGLHGSRHYAEKLVKEGLTDHVEAVIILDMIGDRNLDISFPRNSSSSLMTIAFKCAEDEGVRRVFGLHTANILDDHVPFRKAGMPVIDFIDFNFGSRPRINDYWHTPADTIDKITPQSLGVTGRVVLRMINCIAENEK